MPTRTVTRPASTHFPPHHDPRGVTVTDLLQVREAYHAALANMQNVVATAVGLYRFRRKGDSRGLERRRAGEARTFLNSYTDEHSWPAVLVLVRDWQTPDSPMLRPEHTVPQYLYLPDGRLVPTCVIQVEFEDGAAPSLRPRGIQFPDNLIGGGCGVYTDVQGDEHVGTVTCLVTDGERTFALTSCHVCGPQGQPVYTRRRGEGEEIGRSHPNQARDMRFCDLYSGYPGEHALCNVDAGLIEVADMGRWTSQVLGIGQLDAVADLHPASITLGLIGQKLRASGAASGWAMRGEIVGLFPRYRTIGGVDYLGDVMIAPQHMDGGSSGEPLLRRGDSGALWVLDRGDDAMKQGELAVPVATTWGAMDLQGGGHSYQLAFGAFLSSICKRLDVELVTGHNTGWHPVWGAPNHRAIAEIAASQVATKRGPFALLLTGNRATRSDRLSLMADLANVPDEWKSQGNRFGSEGPNHFADLDMTFKGKMLGGLTLSAADWYQFYTAAQKTPHGALPFRVGEVFEAMVSFRAAGDLRKFLAAAGVLSHYIADACNPAHLSIWGRGEEGWKDSQRSSFHGVWDNRAPLAAAHAAVTQQFDWAEAGSGIRDGAAAAQAALELMRRTARRVKVGDCVSDDAGDSRQAAADYCDSKRGTAAITRCVTDACQVLVSLWQSAWKQGSAQGTALPADATDTVDVGNLHDWAISTKSFLPSRTLKQMQGSAAAPAARPRKRAAKKK